MTVYSYSFYICFSLGGQNAGCGVLVFPCVRFSFPLVWFSGLKCFFIVKCGIMHVPAVMLVWLNV